jgi:hypothetical protein
VLDNPNEVSSGSGKNEIDGYDPRASKAESAIAQAGEVS